MGADREPSLVLAWERPGRGAGGPRPAGLPLGGGPRTAAPGNRGAHVGAAASRVPSRTSLYAALVKAKTQATFSRPR